MGQARFSRIRNFHIFLTLICALIFLANTMFYQVPASPASYKEDSLPSRFAGSEACRNCHQQIFDAQHLTAHFRTSAAAGIENIKGSFDTTRNHYRYNQWMEVVMEKKQNGFFQTGYMNGLEFQSEPFDIVIGSGRKGQSYLYWNNNKLFQLPVSYYTPQDNWCNSPGFPTNHIKFNREIPGACFECHASYISILNETETTSDYIRPTLAYGIGCERCHGPGAEHIAFHQQHKDEDQGKYIINTAHLTRQQRLDACALCHSGFRKELKPTFSFSMGDRLNDFSTAGYSPDSVAVLDVHGNQYGLLTASKCFRESVEMDCSSCHHVHVTEFNQPEIFSQRCLSCHGASDSHQCRLVPPKGVTLSDNCIDCHMPLLPSRKIFLKLEDPKNSTPDMVRSHRIGIYPSITREFLEKFRRN